MALWDLAGKTLGVPTTTLLGGRFRDRVRMYDHAAPRDMLDPASCREWADRVKSDPSGFTAHKFGFPHTDPRSDPARDRSNRVLTTTELSRIRRGFENCREAIGWDHDIMVHCHWEYDLRTSIQLAEAVEPIKPLWLEDPLPPEYSESWRRLVAAAKVPICTGENLVRRQGFKDFIINQGCDILHPDLRNTGGLPRNQADRRPRRGLLPADGHPQHRQHRRTPWRPPTGPAPSATSWPCETVVGQGDWMDDVVLHDGPDHPGRVHHPLRSARARPGIEPRRRQGPPRHRRDVLGLKRTRNEAVADRDHRGRPSAVRCSAVASARVSRLAPGSATGISGGNPDASSNL